MVFENYVFFGGMMVGMDFYIFNVGGLGMVVIGVGGVDVVDVMIGMEWELKMLKLIGVYLIGSLNGWVLLKDVILKLVGILIVKGGMNVIIEYFGEGIVLFLVIGKVIICNMGVEVGVIIFLFFYDDWMVVYLKVIGREFVVEMVGKVVNDLCVDVEVVVNFFVFYDCVIEINLFELEFYINGLFILDVVIFILEFVEKVLVNGYLCKMEVGLIGLCINLFY